MEHKDGVQKHDKGIFQDYIQDVRWAKLWSIQLSPGVGSSSMELTSGDAQEGNLQVSNSLPQDIGEMSNKI